MKAKRLWILLAGLVILMGAFLLINFHAAVSSTRSEDSVSTSRMGDQLPEAMQQRDKIVIIVTGEGSLADAVKKAISAEMNQAGMGDVVLSDVVGPVYGSPVLMVEVIKPEMVWTPFYATSQVVAKAWYASNGDTLHITDVPVRLDNGNGPTLHMFAEYKVNDRSWGLISRPGYDHILADWLAKKVASTAHNLYNLQIPQ